MKLTTDIELAEILGITVEDVRLKCRSEWPCVKPKRSVWRFTDAMVEDIVAKQTVTPMRRQAPLTARSTRRRAS